MPSLIPLATVGSASCLGGTHTRCHLAPETLHNSPVEEGLAQRHGIRLEWLEVIRPGTKGGTLQRVAAHNARLAKATRTLVEEQRPFLVVGGDHAAAMGTWGGVLEGVEEPQRFGLLWIDAHLDAHTFSTTPSGNLHGMPLAALLGQADLPLAKIHPTTRSLSPRNLALIGVRSYEAEEMALLKRLGVVVHTMPELTEAGALVRVMHHLMERLAHRCDRIGISLDLDAVDPGDAPGVETPVAGGIRGLALTTALAGLPHKERLVGLEVAEYTPERDQGNRTLELIGDVVAALFSPSPPVTR